MNRLRTLCLFLVASSSALADPIQITVQCSGAPVREVARTSTLPSSAAEPFVLEPAVKPLLNDLTAPITTTAEPGQTMTFEMIREFRHPKVLSFTFSPEAPIESKEFVTKILGMMVELTISRVENQIVFHGTCTMRRHASSAMALSTTPLNQPCVTSYTIISRECDFAGRTPLGTPAKINLGEQNVDVGELTITFAEAK